MKKYLFLLLPFSLYSSEINFSKTFTKQVPSDMISNQFDILVSRDNSDDITTIFEKYIDIFKTNELISIKLQDNIKANYNTNIYNGKLSYKVKTYSFEKLNDFVKELLYLKDEKNLTLNIQTAKSILSEKLKEQTFQSLRIKAINYGNIYQNRLTNDIRKSCLTKDIKIKDKQIINNITNTLKIFVDYKLECQ